MTGALILIYVPILLFVVAFLYETYLSLVRLRSPKSGKSGYVNATWEVTHTLLVFGVVMLVMLFTKDLDQLSGAIFIPTFIAALFIGLRAACYLYIFYVRGGTKTGLVDWAFALTHIGAALALVWVVVEATVFIIANNPEPNTHFIPAFMPGLVFVCAICALPLITLYRSK